MTTLAVLLPVFSLLSALTPAASAQDAWITPYGAGALDWGSGSVPLDALPRRKDYYLPDSGFIGKQAPDDLEIRAPQGERRFLRYVNGALVDAWWVSAAPIDPGPLTGFDKPVWTGTVLGPTGLSAEPPPEEEGFSAFGVGRSWDVPGRTVFHWHDRMGGLDIIASRALPAPQYGVQRAEPMRPPDDSGAKASVKGTFLSLVKRYKGRLASCFDQSRLPINVSILMRWDRSGLPARIRVEADQPTFNLDTCIAGTLMDVRNTANAQGSLELMRFR